MILWRFIVGIILIIATIGITLICIKKTPENLRGFYGAMFCTIALVGLIGGIIITITAFI